MYGKLFESRLRCTHCSHELDTYFFDGCHSMLGPRLMLCPKCRKITPTGRFEWAQMHLVGKGWYIMFSAIYVFALSMCGATSVWCLMYFWFDAFGKKLGDSTVTALPGMILGGGAAAIIQVFRVRRSLVRTRHGAIPALPPFWIPDVGLKGNVAAVFFLLPLGGFILSLPVKWLLVGWDR
jgi:hypothetical protein